jgi:hypothetical protein
MPEPPPAARRKPKKRYRFKNPLVASTNTKAKRASQSPGVASISKEGESSSIFTRNTSVRAKEDANAKTSKASKSKKSQEASPPSTPKKGGRKFGSRIRGFVKGRTKPKKDGSGEENSLYSNSSRGGGGGDDFDPDNEFPAAPRTALDPNILAKVVEDESLHSFEDDQFDVHGGGRQQQQSRSNNNSYTNNSSWSKGGNDDPNQRNGNGRDNTDTDDEDLSFMGSEEMGGGSQQNIRPLVGPISLVLLLVDPDTLRFELLQLEFETPQDALVSDVLEQIENSVTEKAIQRLTFTALVDRKGEAHHGKDPLGNALTYRKHAKDILVGLSSQIQVDECAKLARPILGDDKVIGMVRTGGT